ncbi:LysR family transcriptional regulator [Duganella sp. FT94W]|uniref:LysR family transcriptional regulator n=1 Tax=Duganella lactea TaxID=2692173 RepID=A0ABW9V4V0_9BURK|nr:LysR family transcriptional regulator [Duganella lactea]MYM33735.1 LysR family transcriptional regulator [Duganella lactea]
MRQKDIFEGVAVFVAVAEAGSFSEAAKRLGITPSAASQSVRSLEERIGAPLLRRTTRSISLTDIGADYLSTAAPALSLLRKATEEAADRNGRVAGLLRLTMPRAPFDQLMADAMVRFQDAYPNVELEIVVEARMNDVVKEGFDAGLRYGNFVEKDMVAVPVISASKAVLVASPDYIQQRLMPALPGDLLSHRTVMCRSQVTGLINPWILQSANETVTIVHPTPTIVQDLTSQIALAVKGLGILSAPLASVVELIDLGKLSHVLPDWASPLEALYLYFPSRRHQSPALKAFITFLKEGSSLSSRHGLASQMTQTT